MIPSRETLLALQEKHRFPLRILDLDTQYSSPKPAARQGKIIVPARQF